MDRHEELDPNFKSALMKNRMSAGSPFWELLGMELMDIKKGWAKVKLPFDRKITQPYGVVHGGAIFGLADSAVAMALLGMVPKGESFTTVEQKINYIKPFSAGEIIAEATIINKGKKLAVGEIDIRDGNGELVAICTATYMILSRRD